MNTCYRYTSAETEPHAKERSHSNGRTAVSTIQQFLTHDDGHTD
jgi:hypothetical protein